MNFIHVGIDGYIGLVDGKLKLNVYDHSLFIFCNKPKNKIKILHYENNTSIVGCFWLYYKRMEYERIKWPKKGIKIEIKHSQIELLLKGLNLENTLNT